MTIEELTAAVRAYNAAQPEKSKRLILEQHSFFCRCTTCWYDYDGPARDKKYGDGGWMSLQAHIAAEREADESRKH